jgi:hypothetical protein
MRAAPSAARLRAPVPRGQRAGALTSVRVDHVIYGTADLDATAARLRAQLGLLATDGGRHDGLGTRNRIVPLGDGSFLELLAVADPGEATRSKLGAALQAAIARGEGLLGWAVAVEDLQPVVERLGTPITHVGRQGMTARLTGLDEALAEPSLPFFIERASAHAPPRTADAAGICWIEVAATLGGCGTGSAGPSCRCASSKASPRFAPSASAGASCARSGVCASINRHNDRRRRGCREHAPAPYGDVMGATRAGGPASRDEHDRVL